MKQINMTCLVDMPDDLFEQAAVSLKVKPAWEAFLAALRESRVAHSTKIDVIVADSPRAKRGKPVPNRPQTLPIADEDRIIPDNAPALMKPGPRTMGRSYVSPELRQSNDDGIALYAASHPVADEEGEVL